MQVSLIKHLIRISSETVTNLNKNSIVNYTKDFGPIKDQVISIVDLGKFHKLRESEFT